MVRGETELQAKRVGLAPEPLIELFFIFAVGSWQMTYLTKDWDFWELFVPQILRGAGMMLAIVPINNMALGTLSAERLKNASGLFNLMRNLGGSVGIATIATMLSRNAQTQYNILGAHVSAYDTRVGTLLAQIRGAFMARGMDFTTATSAAYAALSGMVSQQAVMVAFVQLFRILALVFAVVIPLVFIMRKPKGGGPAPPAH